MKKMCVVRWLAMAAAVVIMPGVVGATPVYVAGSECPPDPATGFSRQYYVTGAIACVYDNDSSNIQGDDAEALALLTNGPDSWGNGWDGLGQEDKSIPNNVAGGVNGFSFSYADAGLDDGAFTFSSPLTTTFGQFAVAVKDGGSPKWAIFLLPAGTTSGNWGFSTEGGDLSHFAIFARGTGTPVVTAAVPEPASLLLFGSGLGASALASRRKRKKA